MHKDKEIKGRNRRGNKGKKYWFDDFKESK